MVKPGSIHRPVRMCLGCRERIPQAELVRVQLTQRGVVIIEHPSGVLAGRSVYFCPKSGCFDRVVNSGEIIFKRSKYDKIIVRLEPRQAGRLRFAFSHAARRLRGAIGVGPSED